MRTYTNKPNEVKVTHLPDSNFIISNEWTPIILVAKLSRIIFLYDLLMVCVIDT